jgi:hypothetical protein
MFNENLNVFFNDFGVPVIRGTSNFLGILEMPDELIANGMAISTDFQLTVKTSDVPNLKYQEAMKVSGIDYTLKEYLLVDDGKITKIILSKT